ncbi:MULTISPECIES: methyltransferase domain-containing protein [unclassified Sinorhizobium]|uniref:methyltransferase domain-containing protein n=1 Tax=unclassified Sinorhizobium TaxID=2613772 RepID=UPI003524B568
MKAIDPYSTTHTLDNAQLRTIVTRLETRARHPLFRKMLGDYLEAINIDAAAAVLDLGCGTGFVARTIALRPNFSGRVLGIDLSPWLVAAAADLAMDEGLDRIGFRAGDSRKLDLADGSFDAIVAHTLISHVEHPITVIREAARLVRPGGMIAIFDGDFASMTYGNADGTRAKANDEAIISCAAINPRVMRHMPRLLQAAGLQLVRTFPYVLAELGRADFWSSAIDAFQSLAPSAGAMTQQEADAWAEELRRDSEAGIFFGAMNYYTFIARRV